MRARTRNVLALLAFLTTTAGPVFGQGDSDPLPLPAGAWSLSFSLPSGGGASLGVWKLVGARTNVGLDIGLGSASTSDNLRFDDGQPAQEFNSSSLRIAIEPSIRQYIATYRTLAPYVHGNLEFAYTSLDAETVNQQATTVRKTYEYGIGVGIGVEWAPLERFSIGGHTGVRFSYLDRSNVDSSPVGTRVQDGSATTFDTFVSSLVFNCISEIPPTVLSLVDDNEGQAGFGALQWPELRRHTDRLAVSRVGKLLPNRAVRMPPRSSRWAKAIVCTGEPTPGV